MARPVAYGSIAAGGFGTQELTSICVGVGPIEPKKGQVQMKKVVLSVIAALALGSGPALAADMPTKAAKAVVVAPPPSPWDIAFGAAIMNDYVFRGITQSNHKPSVAAYFEPRYNLNKDVQLYVGISGESISFPNRAAAKIDFYGGARWTLGPVVLDGGFWYYYYPGGQCFGGFAAGGGTPCVNTITPSGNAAKADASFYEVYGKATYTWTDWAFGINEFYSPNFLNTGAYGNYLSGTVKFTAPDKMALGPFGWYVSGEFGRQWLGTSDPFYGVAAFPAGITTGSPTTRSRRSRRGRRARMRSSRKPRRSIRARSTVRGCAPPTRSPARRSSRRWRPARAGSSCGTSAR